MIPGRHRMGLVAGAALGAIALAMALVSLVWTPFDVTGVDVANRLLPPGGAHPLGTDHLGRDLLSMVMIGARTSLSVALLAVIELLRRRSERLRGVTPA